MGNKQKQVSSIPVPRKSGLTKEGRHWEQSCRSTSRPIHRQPSGPRVLSM